MGKFFRGVILICVVLNTANCFAQKGFRVGIVGGPQESQWTQDDFTSVRNIPTYNGNAGLTFGYNFSKKFGVGLDVRYSAQGQRYKIEIQSVNATNTGFYTSEVLEINQKLNYIKIPIMFTYNSTVDKRAAFVAQIGSQISFLTKAKFHDISTGYRYDNTKSYSKKTLGIVLVAQERFRIAERLFLSAGLRVDIDFTNAIIQTPPFGSAHNSTSAIDIGLHYLIKPKAEIEPKK